MALMQLSIYSGIPRDERFKDSCPGSRALLMSKIFFQRSFFSISEREWTDSLYSRSIM